MKIPSMNLDLPARGLEKHQRPAMTSLKLVAALLVGLAGCSSGGSVDGAGGGGDGGRAGGVGVNGIGGSAVTGAAGSQGGQSDGRAGGSSDGGAAGAGGAGANGGSAGSSAGGTLGGAGGVSGGAGSGGALEAISVPAGGTVTKSKMNLDSGALFLLKAVGSLKAGTGADAQYGDMDAEYGGITAGGTGQDIVAGVDVGIDVGFSVERAPAGTTVGRKKWFGPYRSDHTYGVIVTGAGAPLSLKTIQPPSSTATGAITVSILRLSPTPTQTLVVLDSFNAPLTNRIVHSNMTTTMSTVYLLKVAGSGKVGGNTLGLGDADWMDWAANGNGRVDVGDGNVDYGLGVDEFNTAVSPRLRWWGPWRQDHTYYMLFAGTGNTIGFMYYDIGYGDNSATDMLALQVLELP